MVPKSQNFMIHVAYCILTWLLLHYLTVVLKGTSISLFKLPHFILAFILARRCHNTVI